MVPDGELSEGVFTLKLARNVVCLPWSEPLHGQSSMSGAQSQPVCEVANVFLLDCTCGCTLASRALAALEFLLVEHRKREKNKQLTKNE